MPSRERNLWRDRCQRRGSAGFTLVEVLVALAVTGLLLALLDGMALQFARSAQHIGAAAATLEAEDDCARVLRLLLADVELDRPGTPPANLIGNRDMLMVTTRGPEILALSSPAQFRLSIAPQRDQEVRQRGEAVQSLVLEWHRPDGGTDGKAGVVSDVSAFHFAYLGKDEGAVWSDDWHRPVQELRLLRVAGTLVERGRTVPIEATFPIVPTMPHSCVIDPLQARCPEW